MDRNKIVLSLGIYKFENITHEEISNRLEIDPVHVHIKGERRNPNNPDSPVWKDNSWFMNSRLDEYADFDSQMDAMLSTIEQKIEAFKLFTTKYYCEFSCAIFVYRDNGESIPWVHLDKRYNKLAAELNIKFDIDFYVF